LPNNQIARGVIVGIELLPAENPEYSYKIKLYPSVIDANGKGDDIHELNCDNMFATIEEAKQSAIQMLEKSYELQKNEIEQYFGQFK
jgi:hypothetical protein